MRTFFILIAIEGAIIQFNLQDSIGQVIEDLSGSSNYCVLGPTLTTDSSDPILTDRGGYFTSSSYISFPPNSLLPSISLSLTDFYGVFFIKMLASGTIFSVFTSNSILIKVYHDSQNSIKISQYISSSYSGTKSTSLELNVWKTVFFSYSFIDLGNCDPCGLSITVDSASQDIDGVSLSSGLKMVRLGSYSGTDGFEGFITYFELFDGTDYVSAYDKAWYLISATEPSGGTNPYYSSSGALCDCGIYSCTGSGVVPSCIQCDESCGLYCTSTKTNCLDIVSICYSKAIVNNICDSTVDYIENCYSQTSSTVCVECDTGYLLSTGKDGCCLSGYYYSISGCSVCHSSCVQCSGGTISDCTECVDTLKLPNNGVCTCIDGYYLESSANTEYCSVCDSSCSKCSSGGIDGCNECAENNAEIYNTPGTCVCKSGFWASSQDPIVCESCFYTCNKCSGSSENNCTACIDENSSLKDGKCECVNNFFWNSSSSLCESCHFTCETCSGPLESECTSCKNENSSLSDGSCKCLDNMYWNTTSLLCEICLGNCISCNNFNNCTACKDSFYLSTDSLCLPCIDNCGICSSSKCQICEQGYTLNIIDCIRSELFLFIKIVKFGTILLNFTENLAQPLNNASLMIRTEDTFLTFNVTQDSLKEYFIEIQDFKSNKKKIDLFLLFDVNITSETNSLLIKRDFNCFFLQGNLGDEKVPVYIRAMSRSVASTITATAAFSVLSNNKFGSIWGFINTIQVLSYLPLINIDLPDILSEFLLGVSPLGPLPNIWNSLNVLNCNSTDINSKFHKHGFSCKHFIYNTGELLLFFLLGILFFILLLFLYIIKFKYFKNLIIAKLKSYKWAYFYRFWIQSYIELVFPVIISLNTASFNNVEDSLNSVFGIIVAIILFVSPGYTVLFYRYKDVEIIEKNQELIKRFSPLFEGFELSSHFYYFFPYYFVWRIIYACVLYNLDYNPYAQISICCGLQVVNIGLMVKFRVYKKKVDFYMYLFYESIILVVFCVVGMFLIDFSDRSRDGLSYFAIGITCAGIFAGIFVSGLESAKKIIRKCRGQSNDCDIVVEFKNNRSGSLFAKVENKSDDFMSDDKSNIVQPVHYDYLKQHVPSVQGSFNIDESE